MTDQHPSAMHVVPVSQTDDLDDYQSPFAPPEPTPQHITPPTPQYVAPEHAQPQTENFLSRDAILAKIRQGVATEKVHVPEWGGFVMVREMTAGEMDQRRVNEVQYTSDRTGKSETKIRTVRARIVARCVTDLNGKPLFSTDDVRALMNAGSRPIARIMEAIDRLSNYTEEDQRKEKEALEDSLKMTGDADFFSDSP